MTTASTFFWERFDGAVACLGSAYVPIGTPRWLEHWRDVLGDPDGELLRKRWAWDGVLSDDVVGYAEEVGAGAADPPIDWLLRQAHRSRDACTEDGVAAQGVAVAAPLASSTGSTPLPFADLLFFVADVVLAELCGRLRCCDGAGLQAAPYHLATAAVQSLLTHWAECLLDVLGSAVIADFEDGKPFGLSLLASLGADAGRSPSTAYFDAFVTRLVDEGLQSVFAGQPVLSRLVRQQVENSAAAAAEFLQRLAADRCLLDAEFDGGCGVVASLRLGLSDPHAHGRCVVAVTFESGRRVVYKPRSLDNDARFASVCAWSNRQPGLLDLKAVHVMRRAGYGWAEFVTELPCMTATELARFYQRAGQLLAWFYVLRATDCHLENLIASGEYLVPVDLETLLQPDPVPIDGALFTADTEHALNLRLKRSVLRSGMLPSWSFSSDGTVAFDLSALGGIEPPVSMTEVKTWTHVNTDQMACEMRRVVLPRAQNRPVDDMTPVDLHAHVGEVADGFAAMYDVIRNNVEALVAPGGLLHAFQAAVVRVLLRDTQVYVTLRDTALRAGQMRDGLGFSIELDRLAMAFLACETRPPAWGIVRAEQEALGRLDVPVFHAPVDGTALHGSTEPLCDAFFVRPAYAEMLDGLALLGDEDRRFQIELIHSAFAARIAAMPEPVRPKDGSSLVRAPSAPDFLAEARRLADALADSAVYDASGELNWIGLCAKPSAERFQLQGAGDDLYDGRCGIALFFAALHRATGEGRYRALALDTIRSIQLLKLRQLRNSRVAREWVSIAGLGGMTGLGGILYSLSVMSALLPDDGLAQQALELAAFVDDAAMAASTQVDLVSGHAGGLLGLLALHERTGEAGVLSRASRLGARIVGLLHDRDGSFQPVRSNGRPLLTGMSHGAAGVSHALWALHGKVGGAGFDRTALACCAYERSLFDPATMNWPDLRSAGSAAAAMPLVRWCHGAPGIALARLHGAAHVGDALGGTELSAALHTTVAAGQPGVDHLCCGAFGISDILLEAGRRLPQRRYADQAREFAGRAMDGAARHGAYQLFSNLPRSTNNAGFLVGLAGIGYTLLRLADMSLPCVLAMEAWPAVQPLVGSGRAAPPASTAALQATSTSPGARTA